MRRLITLFLAGFCTVGVFGQAAQTSLNKLLNRKVPCQFEGNTIKTDTTLYAESRNVSYSYSYLYPKYFTEVWPKEEVVGEVRSKTNAYIDTVTYISSDKQAQFKIFAGQVVPFPLGKKRAVKAGDVLLVEKAIDDYIRLIRAGKDKELGKIKIESLCKGINGYNFNINVKGYRGDKQFLYKIIVAELPATGELIFSHFLFQYTLTAKDKYEALAVTLGNEFKAD